MDALQAIVAEDALDALLKERVGQRATIYLQGGATVSGVLEEFGPGVWKVVDHSQGYEGPHTVFERRVVVAVCYRTD